MVVKYQAKFLTFKPKLNHVAGDYSALHVATQIGFVEAIGLLLDHGANINLLSPAAGNPDPFKHKSYIKIMNILLDNKADIDFQASDERTVLIAAAMWADQKQALEKVSLLLDRGAKPDIVKHGGETALMLAAGRGNDKVVKLLIEKGADVNMKNGAGESLCAMQ